jgi:hypothetical protein
MSTFFIIDTKGGVSLLENIRESFKGGKRWGTGRTASTPYQTCMEK